MTLEAQIVTLQNAINNRSNAHAKSFKFLHQHRWISIMIVWYEITWLLTSWSISNHFTFYPPVMANSETHGVANMGLPFLWQINRERKIEEIGEEDWQRRKIGKALVVQLISWFPHAIQMYLFFPPLLSTKQKAKIDEHNRKVLFICLCHFKQTLDA